MPSIRARRSDEVGGVVYNGAFFYLEAMMGLNIESKRAQALAEELAKETGQTMAAAIESALEDQLMRIHRHKEREYRFNKIKEIVSKLPPVPHGVTSDHSDLYDDDGLPA